MTDFQELYDAADAAGKAAVDKMIAENKIAPMIVGPYYIEDGVCGFAWICVKPGNSRFANWLKKSDLAQRDTYNGGVTIWVSNYNQSMEKKKEYAKAFADVLSANGIRAYSQSRID